MIKVMFISFWVNLFLSSTKIMVGVLGHSSPLIADGVSSLSDMVTDIFAIIGGFLSKKPADKSHPFGYGLIENIASLLISIFIIIMGLLLIIDISFEKLENTKYFVLIYAILAIIIKYFLVKYVEKKGKELNSDLLNFASKESEADLIGTVVVLVSTVLMMLADHFTPLIYANVVGTVIISILIIKTGFSMLKFNAGELSYKKFNGTLNEDAHEVIKKYKEVKKIKKLYIFKYGNAYQLLAEVTLTKDIMLSEANILNNKIEKDLKKINIKYIYIEMSS